MHRGLELAPFVEATHEVIDLVRDGPVVHRCLLLPIKDGLDLFDELLNKLACMVPLGNKLSPVCVLNLESFVPALFGLCIEAVTFEGFGLAEGRGGVRSPVFPGA